MASNDFFLNFGSNANVFANNLRGQLDPAIDSIYGLADALVAYDKQLEKTRSNKASPLANLFQQVDDAADTFGSLTDQLASSFEGALTSVERLAADVRTLVDEVKTLQVTKPAGRTKLAESIHESLNVPQEDIDKAKQRNRKSLSDILNSSTTDAYNALRRIANTNATLAQRATDANNALQELSKGIGKLRLTARDAGRSDELQGGGPGGVISGGQFSGNIVINGGDLGAAIANALRGFTPQQAVSQAVSAVASAPSPSEPVEANRTAVRRKGGIEEISSLTEPARPGIRFVVHDQDSSKSFPVGQDVREGENFAAYRNRQARARAAAERVRATLPVPEDLEQHRADLNQVQKFIGAGGGRFGDVVFPQILQRILQRPGGSAVTAETVKGSVQGLDIGGQLRAQLKGPQADSLARGLDLLARRIEAAETGLAAELRQQPNLSFGRDEVGPVLGAHDTGLDIIDPLKFGLGRVDERLAAGLRGVEPKVTLPEPPGPGASLDEISAFARAVNEAQSAREATASPEEARGAAARIEDRAREQTAARLRGARRRSQPFVAGETAEEAAVRQYQQRQQDDAARLNNVERPVVDLSAVNQAAVRRSKAFQDRQKLLDAGTIPDEEVARRLGLQPRTASGIRGEDAEQYVRLLEQATAARQRASILADPESAALELEIQQSSQEERFGRGALGGDYHVRALTKGDLGKASLDDIGDLKYRLRDLTSRQSYDITPEQREQVRAQIQQEQDDLLAAAATRGTADQPGIDAQRASRGNDLAAERANRSLNRRALNAQIAAIQQPDETLQQARSRYFRSVERGGLGNTFDPNVKGNYTDEELAAAGTAAEEVRTRRRAARAAKPRTTISLDSDGAVLTDSSEDAGLSDKAKELSRSAKKLAEEIAAAEKDIRTLNEILDEIHVADVQPAYTAPYVPGFAHEGPEPYVAPTTKQEELQQALAEEGAKRARDKARSTDAQAGVPGARGPGDLLANLADKTQRAINTGILGVIQSQREDLRGTVQSNNDLRRLNPDNKEFIEFLRQTDEEIVNLITELSNAEHAIQELDLAEKARNELLAQQAQIQQELNAEIAASETVSAKRVPRSSKQTSSKDSEAEAEKAAARKSLQEQAAAADARLIAPVEVDTQKAASLNGEPTNPEPVPGSPLPKTSKPSSSGPRRPLTEDEEELLSQLGTRDPVALRKIVTDRQSVLKQRRGERSDIIAQYGGNPKDIPAGPDRERYESLADRNKFDQEQNSAINKIIFALGGFTKATEDATAVVKEETAAKKGREPKAKTGEPKVETPQTTVIPAVTASPDYYSGDVGGKSAQERAAEDAATEAELQRRNSEQQAAADAATEQRRAAARALGLIAGGAPRPTSLLEGPEAESLQAEKEGLLRERGRLRTQGGQIRADFGVEGEGGKRTIPADSPGAALLQDNNEEYARVGARLTEINVRLNEMAQALRESTRAAQANADATTTEAEATSAARRGAARRGGAGGGGGGRKPPTGGGTGGPDDPDEPEEEPLRIPKVAVPSVQIDDSVQQQAAERRNNARKAADAGKGRGGKPKLPPVASPVDYSQLISQLAPETQQILDQVKQDLSSVTDLSQLTQEQVEKITQAAQAFAADPKTEEYVNQATRKGVFAQAAGIPGNVDPSVVGSGKFVTGLFKEGGSVDIANSLTGGRNGTSRNTSQISQEQQDRFAQIQARINAFPKNAAGQNSAENEKIAQALLAQYAAQNKYNEAVDKEGVASTKAATAQRALSVATQQVEKAERDALAAAGEGGILERLFGKQGAIDGLIRHVGSEIERLLSFQLVFTGFDKIKELVDTGLQAQAAFVRLQATLSATGQNVTGLQSKLESVSSSTGEDLVTVTEAAAELGGVFKNNADLIEGTKVASELANISQGTLTAKEAAIGLRDVTDAYGIQGIAAIQGVGDEIAKLSQITGVSVKDITEGTTQLAQEAHDFNLSLPQAATLSAFVTRSTGETGEEASEQVSRILATLNTGRVQKLLTTTRVPGQGGATLATPDQFASGDISGVITNLLKNYDKLSAGQRQAINALLASGRQAKAFAGLLRDAGAAVDAFNDSSNVQGALEKQNAAYLQTIDGQIKVLGTDFKNLGAELQRSGFLDIIGLAAKGVDDLVKAFDLLLRGVNFIEGLNPIIKDFSHLLILVGELTLAFKLFGGGLGQIAGGFNRNRARVDDTVDAEGNLVRGTGKFVPLTTREVNRGITRAPATILGVPGRAYRRFRNRGKGAEEVAENEPIVPEGTVPEVAPPATGPYEEPAAEEETEPVAVARRRRFGRFRRNAPVTTTVAPEQVAAEEEGAVEEEDAVTSGRRGFFGRVFGRRNTSNIEAAGADAEAVTTEATTAATEAAAAKAAEVAAEAATAAAVEAARAAAEEGAAEGAAEGEGATAGGGTSSRFRRKKPSITEEERAASEAEKAESSVSRAARAEEVGTIAASQERLGGIVPRTASRISTRIRGLSAPQGILEGPIDSVAAYQDRVGGRATSFLRNTGSRIASGARSIGTNIKNALPFGGGGKAASEAEGAAAAEAKVAGAAESEAGAMGKLSGAYGNFTNGMIASTAAIIGFTLVIDEVTKAFQKYGQVGTDANTAGNALRTGQADTTGSAAAGAASATDGSLSTILGQRLHGESTADPDSVGGVDSGFSSTVTSTEKLIQTRLRKALAAGPNGSKAQQDALAGANTKVEGDIKNEQSYIDSLGLSSGQRAVAENDLNNIALAFQNQFAGLQATAEGIKKIDQLNTAQTADLVATLSATNGLSSQAFADAPGLSKSILANSLVPQGSAAYNALSGALNNTGAGTNTYGTRIQSEIAADQAVISNDQAQLDAGKLPTTNDAQNPSGPTVSSVTAEEEKAASDEASLQASQYTTPAQSHSTYAEIDTAQGDNGGAINQLKAANTDLTNFNKTLQTDDPQYVANLKQINDNKVQIAQLSQQTAIATAQIAESNTLDPVQQAAYAMQAALAQQKAVAAEPGGGSVNDRASAQEAVNQARLQGVQAAQDVTQSQFATTSALDSLQGDDYDAAVNNLKGANQQLQYAIANYGQNSSAANQAQAAVYADTKALQQSATDHVNASLDLQIAQLNAAGKDLGQAAAGLQVQEAQNAIDQFTKNGGSTSSDAYKKLQGNLVTAQRNNIDVAVQAQLDTLDFQKQTYQITSSQEVQSLQQILKNKQLTLKEQRDITLKIRDLQQSVRQQLTGGGLNIPTNITLPSAFEVRRAIAGGLNPGNPSSTTVATTTVQNVSNNVTINNTVSTDSQAKTISDNVAKSINGKTTVQSRANSATPRLVQV